MAVAMALSTSSTTSSHISHSASHVYSPATPIDRESVVRRHVVVLSGVGSDPRADTAHITYGALTMTVGNGVIGFNADATGMQSLNLTCVFSTPCTCDLSPISVCIFESLCSIACEFVPCTPPSLKRKCPETCAIHNVRLLRSGYLGVFSRDACAHLRVCCKRTLLEGTMCSPSPRCLTGAGTRHHHQTPIPLTTTHTSGSTFQRTALFRKWLHLLS